MLSISSLSFLSLFCLNCFYFYVQFFNLRVCLLCFAMILSFVSSSLSSLVLSIDFLVFLLFCLQSHYFTPAARFTCFHFNLSLLSLKIPCRSVGKVAEIVTAPWTISPFPPVLSSLLFVCLFCDEWCVHCWRVCLCAHVQVCAGRMSTGWRITGAAASYFTSHRQGASEECSHARQPFEWW